MSVDPETRQRLLELIYGLLAEDEAAALRGRIEADPDLARAYAVAEATAALFAEAARLDAPPVPLRRPEKPVAVPFAGPPEQATPKPAAPRTAVARRPERIRWANWAVGVSAAIVLAAAIGGYAAHRAWSGGA
ncbi:MAG: hypothetical protein NUV77_13290, partial [Thermoguttaceae bacterium]|nr:hypothetical protein [Thermoguttaceae bacterium]